MGDKIIQNLKAILYGWNKRQTDLRVQTKEPGTVLYIYGQWILDCGIVQWRNVSSLNK